MSGFMKMQMVSEAVSGSWSNKAAGRRRHLQQARKITLPGLTPGQVYSVQSRAIDGSTGQSDWSDPTSHIST